jgi:hypothetical protein
VFPLFCPPPVHAACFKRYRHNLQVVFWSRKCKVQIKSFSFYNSYPSLIYTISKLEACRWSNSLIRTFKTLQNDYLLITILQKWYKYSIFSDNSLDHFHLFKMLGLSSLYYRLKSNECLIASKDCDRCSQWLPEYINKVIEDWDLSHLLSPSINTTEET